MENTKDYSRKELIMLALLLILTIIIRLPTTSFPGTPDSYTMQGKSISIIEEGYANWVLHPASLFGLYPISYPTAYMYFLSHFSLITGLTIVETVQVTAIIIGVIGTLGLFIFAKEFGSFLFAYLSALIFSISVYFVNFTTAGNASARIFLLSLLPLFMWLLLKIYNSKNKVKYILFSIMSYILIAMSHRLVQLVSVVLAAYFLSILYVNIRTIWSKIQDTKFGKIYFKKRYEISKKNIVFDMFLMLIVLGLFKLIKNKLIILIVYLLILIYFILLEYKKYSSAIVNRVKSIPRMISEITILVFIVILSKIADLTLRGRLGIQIERQIVKYDLDAGLTGLFTAINILFIILGIITILMGLFVMMGLFTKKIKLTKISLVVTNLQKKSLTIIKTKTHLCISILLLIVFSALFISQFFGHSLYSLRVEDYYETKLFEGTSPFTMFLNMSINYTTGTTIFFPLVALGLVILIFKKNKNFPEIFLILIMMGLTSMLLDKRYTRLFVIQFFSLFVGITLLGIIRWTNRLKFRKTVFTSFILLFIILISFSAVFANREHFFEKEKGQEQESMSKQGYTAAMFMKNLNRDKAVIGDTGLSIIYGLSEAKLVPSSYIHRLDLKAKSISFKEIIDSIFSGTQIKSIWKVEDWINGGEYYDGKHGWQILNTPYASSLNQKLLKDYQVQYFVRNKKESKEKLFSSIEPIKNKVYDNPSIGIWDMSKEKGRS